MDLHGSHPFEDVTFDDIRTFWDRRPCNLRHSDKPVGTKEYFEQGRERRYFVEPHIPALAEFDKWAGKEVLEIGCGIGADTVEFARRGAHVTAVELSDESLKLARKRAEVYGVHVNFLNANVERLSESLPVRPFDLVYSCGVIHHTREPEKAIAELKKYMSKDSVLKLLLYHRRSWRVLEILFAERWLPGQSIDRAIAKYSEAQEGCPVTFAYTEQGVRTLLHDFEITELKIAHIFPYRVADYTQYRYRKRLLFKLMPAFVYSWLCRKFGWHLCITAKLKSD